ncbi:hypothetical protein IAT38_002691 [Cryptococcus sp. DSM 104549]
MSTKKAIKSIKAHIQAKDYEAALYESTELLKSIGDSSPTDAAQVLVFRGLSLAYLKRLEEAEKSYLHAYRLDRSNLLVSHGIVKLYTEGQSWDKLGQFLESEVQATYDDGNGEKCAKVLQDLLSNRQTHGTQDELYRTFDLLLPSSPLVPLLQSLTPPSDTYTPLATPTYPPPIPNAPLPPLPSPLPHPIHLAGSLPLLLHVLIHAEAAIHSKIDSLVAAGRKRLGAGPEKEVRKKVDREVLGGDGMKLVELYKEVSGHPQAEEKVMREADLREFEYWKRLVACLGQEGKPKSPTKPPVSLPTKPSTGLDIPTPELFQPKTYETPSKESALARVNDLANGFVLLNIGGKEAEEGWAWVLEGKDEPTLFYDLELLHKYAKAFPDSRMTDFIDDYCRWFKLPLPEPEEEDAPAASDAGAEPSAAGGEAKKPAAKRYRGKKKGGHNARERRKARRAAGKEGLLAEDLDQEERDELVSGMTKLLDQLPRSIFAHRVVAAISLQEEDWANTVTIAEKGRQLVKELEAERGTLLPNVRASLDTILGTALVSYFPPKNHPRATKLLNSVLKDSPSYAARFARARIYQAAGKWAEARMHFQILLDEGGDDKEMVNAREEVGWCLVNEGKLEEGRDILEGIVEVRDGKEGRERENEAAERARAWWRLGRTEWMIGDDESRQHAEDWFMASIRALPTFAPSYTALGECYSNSTPPDTDRALKCFQKAFELDPTEAEAAHKLAIGYADEDEWALVRSIAVRVMEGEGGLEGVAGGEAMNPKGRFAPQNGWAWKAIGSTEVHYKNYAKAAQAFQIALRADENDVSTHIMLGESYVKCGRHIAGLKALEHALTLDPTSWRALYDIGDTHAQLGAFDKAIEAYERVLQLRGEGEVGVLAALGEANLALGRQTAAGGFRERSRGAFHRAIALATKVLVAGEGHRPWAWKLVGDAAFELANQESSLEEAQDSLAAVQPALQHLVQDDTDRRSAVPGLGHGANLLQAPCSVTYTLRTAVFAYAYRAHLLKNEPRVSDPALFDYAAALHALASRLEDGGEEKTACLKGAIGAVRAALERDAGDERLWNALGVFCAGAGRQVAQHAFVVSLELYAKDPIVWVNLGYLYLRLEDDELASQCFLKAQIIDPDYAQAWYGQGLLADRNGDKEQAKALFSHSVTLSAQSLLEADLALAAATFTRFLTPDSTIDPGILHQPAFALKHYTHQRPRDFTALHLYALISERLGLIAEAVSALERASAVLEDEFEHTESVDVEARYAVALCNLGRVRLAAGDYPAALEALGNCWELIAPSQDPSMAALRPQCRLLQGLAHYWSGEIDESLEAFQASLDEAGKSGVAGVKDEVAVLLSRTLWGLGGEDAKETAKSNLMECLSQEKPPLKIISTLAAIAVISHDADLTEAAMSELLTRPDIERASDPSGQADLVLYLHALADGRAEDAYHVLEDGVAARGGAAARNRLAEALIQAGKSKDAIGVLGKADPQEVVEVEVRAEGERLRGVAEVLEGDEEGVKRVQRGVMLAPWLEEGWEALAWGRKIVAEAEVEGGEVEQKGPEEGAEVEGA